MLQHCVLLSLKDPDNLSALDEPMALISGLVDKLSGVLSVTHGPNLDLEGKSKPFQYGFIVTVSMKLFLPTMRRIRIIKRPLQC
jgi:hypothetical protein